jgi:glycosyltransferase involved in cell wall biosynthesis
MRLIWRLPRQVIHLHIGGDITNRLLLLLLYCSFLPGSRTVLTLHSGGYPTSEEGRASHPGTFRAFVFRRLNRLIAVNEQLAQLFVEKFGASPERVKLIAPHALPGQLPEEIPEFLSDFLRNHSPVFLSMGWLQPEYDYPLQIRALEQIRKRHPQAGLMIFGSGRLETELRTQIQAADCEDAVLLAGDVAHAAAQKALAQCDVFLRTTHYDGDSISVREALHWGTPVIATDNGMRPAGVTLMPIGDLNALVNAIEHVLQQPRSGPRTAAADDSNIRAVYRVYEELC